MCSARIPICGRALGTRGIADHVEFTFGPKSVVWHSGIADGFCQPRAIDCGERTLELRKLLGRFIDVCNAIEYAHNRGDLHRDLRPGNIMLGKYGETLVVDWGFAKSVGRSDKTTAAGEAALQPSSGSGASPTQMGSAIGTPPYMSPEQIAGRRLPEGDVAPVRSALPAGDCSTRPSTGSNACQTNSRPAARLTVTRWSP